MHTPRIFFLLLLHQMWWRLKGNSYARGLTKMNLMSRFLFDFFVLFCSFVFSPANCGRHPTACRENKQTRNRNKQQATPLHTCVPRPLNLGTSNSLSLALCRV
uniref:Putative secreted protein n=1 Tax=Ixodes ricinus TaxID=34613 RepID=A0A6B0UFK1_IXORI